MSVNSSIEWTDASWNPVTGCTEVSPGCDHCYAKTFAERFRGVAGHPYEQGFDIRLWPDRLTLPERWRKPRRIFVNSMSDLFHKDVPDEFIQRIFGVMADAKQHTFQVLTKRPKRMARLLGDWYASGVVFGARGCKLPLQNVWAGTSVENDTYSWRANYLHQVPAIVHFVSAEPLLGPLPGLHLDGLDWLIVGGESGHNARPIDFDWVRQLRDRCARDSVAFFFKQVGGRTPKAGGRLLDGRTWDEYPQVAV